MIRTPQLNRRQVLQTGAIAAGVIATASGGAAIIGAAKPIPVAFLIDDNATVIDFAGPWEVFQDAGVANIPGFEMFTVAPTKAPLGRRAGYRSCRTTRWLTRPPRK